MIPTLIIAAALSAWPTLPPLAPLEDQGVLLERDPKPKQIDARIKLVIVYGTKTPDSVFAVARAVVARGYDVEYANAALPRNVPYLERYEIDATKLPYYLIYRGHQAIETGQNTWSEANLVKWFEIIRAGKTWQTAARDKVVDGMAPLDKEVLQWKWSPSSCWMANCPIHGAGWYLEKVQPAVPVLNLNPTPGCPDSRCPTWRNAL